MGIEICSFARQCHFYDWFARALRISSFRKKDERLWEWPVVAASFLPARLMPPLLIRREELSEFVFRIIHNWTGHFVRCSMLDGTDQTALLQANSIAGEFEFEIRTASGREARRLDE